MKQFRGKVIKKKMEKTATVLVERWYQYPIYKKRIKRSKKYLVHDELGVAVGDKVLIEECRPLSKRKRFKIVKVIEKGEK